MTERRPEATAGGADLDKGRRGRRILWRPARGLAVAAGLALAVLVAPLPASASDAGSVVDLGDITDLDDPEVVRASLSGAAGEEAVWTFALSEPMDVRLALRRLDADADLVLEDAAGSELAASRRSGDKRERLQVTLLSGSYTVRAVAVAEEENDFELGYAVFLPNPKRLAELLASAAPTEIELDEANYASRGMWSDGTTIWVSDTKSDAVFAYELGSGERDSASDIDSQSATGIGTFRGMWSDGVTLWVAGGHEKLFGFDVATGDRDESKFVVLAETSGNNNTQGMWSDGTTVWIADGDDAKIYAYVLATGAHDSAKDIDTLGAAGNNHARGMWSDGTTMWVADARDKKIYAYVLDGGERAADKDIDNLRTAGVERPWGIWSDGTTMWIGDVVGNRLIAHDMPAGS